MLRDVIEDTSITAEDLAHAGFSPAIIESVQSHTRGAGETYIDFVRRAGGNSIGRVVKIADIADNLSPDRQGAITANQVDRYETARAMLQEEVAVR